jgi:hypothetical protein
LREESQEKSRLAAPNLDNKSGHAGEAFRQDIFPRAFPTRFAPGGG